MGVNVRQLTHEIIIPTLGYLGLSSPASVALVLGTICQESGCGTFLRQYPCGPALGICQMETATHDDIWQNYMAYHLRRIDLFNTRWGSNPTADKMVYDLSYAVAMCRIHYARVKEPLPQPHDLEGLARYWKRYYNTPDGAGTESEFIANWHKYVPDGWGILDG